MRIPLPSRPPFSLRLTSSLGTSVTFLMVGALLLTTTVSRFSEGRFRAECGFCISTMIIALHADNDVVNDTAK